MSDPTELNKDNPHPVSQHRTPHEIAEDEAGPIGRPDPDMIARGLPNATPPQKPAPEHARLGSTIP